MNEIIESTVENLEVVTGETIPTESATEIDTAADAVTEVVADAAETSADAVTEVVAEASANVVAEEVTEAVSDVTSDIAVDVPQADSSEPLQEESSQAEDSQDASAEPTAAVEDSQQETKPESKQESEDPSNVTKVVRTLTVGQEISGVVKRITDFGAFVDIGVGRDGLIHISELSVRRVGKVGDVLKDGQKIDAWIKKLDRERNRINLTMISPDTKTIRDLVKDELIKGKVTRVLPYGVFVDIGVERDALLHIREMSDGFINKPEDVVTTGDEIEARIINISRRRGRVDLSLKGLGPEPEPEVDVTSEAEQNSPQRESRRDSQRDYYREPRQDSRRDSKRNSKRDRDQEQSNAQENLIDDPFSDTEVLSPMELAFKKAMEADGSTFKLDTSKRNKKRKRRTKSNTVQDEIITRTLDTDI